MVPGQAQARAREEQPEVLPVLEALEDVPVGPVGPVEQRLLRRSVPQKTRHWPESPTEHCFRTVSWPT